LNDNQRKQEGGMVTNRQRSPADAINARHRHAKRQFCQLVQPALAAFVRTTRRESNERTTRKVATLRSRNAQCDTHPEHNTPKAMQGGEARTLAPEASRSPQAASVRPQSGRASWPCRTQRIRRAATQIGKHASSRRKKGVHHPCSTLTPEQTQDKEPEQSGALALT
jgi:hypothetical protein